MGWREFFGLRAPSPAPAISSAPWARSPRAPAPRASYARAFLAASSDRLASDLVPYSSARNINADLRASLAVMRARSRHLAKNNDHARSLLKLVRRNIVGPHGVRVQSRVRTSDGRKFDRDAIARIEASFVGWSRRGKCTADGQLSRAGLERLVATQVATDGEVFVRLMRPWRHNKWAFALQLIDADMVPENLNAAAGDGQVLAGFRLEAGHDVVMGVERDKFKRPVAYWMRQPSALETSPAASLNYARIPAEDVLHVFIPDFIGQVRGAPWFFSGMRRLAMLAGYEEAELVASRVASAKMGFFTSEAEDAPLPHDAEGADGRRYADAEPGAFDQLPPGTDFKPWDPQHPTDAFSAFTTTLLRAFSSGAGVSYSALTGDLSSANYSSLRQGALEERDEWRLLQGWFIEQLTQPVFEAWLDQALMFGALPGLAPEQLERWADATYQARGWQWVDPGKEADADERAVRLGVKTRQQICAERGLDFEEVLEQLREETRLAKQYGVDIAGTATSAPPVSPDVSTDGEEDVNNANAEDRTPAQVRKLRSRRRG